MRKHHWTNTTASILLASFGLGVGAFASGTYIAKKGDKLSKIASHNVAGPVWGERGTLKAIVALNPAIKNPDLIYPNQEIQLPVEPSAAPISQSVISSERAPAAEETSTAPVISAPTISRHDETANSLGGLFEVSPYYALTSVSSTDKNTGSPANAASSVNTGVDFHSYQNWSEGFRTFAQLKLGELSFAQPTDASKTLQRASNFMSGIGLGGEFDLSSSLSLRLFGNYEKRAVLEGISTNSVAVDAVSVPELGTSIALDLLKKEFATLGVSAQFSELFQATTSGYTVSQGNLYGGKVYFRQAMDRSTLQTELGYFSRQQNTNLTNQTQRDFILQLKWFLPFGKREATH